MLKRFTIICLMIGLSVGLGGCQGYIDGKRRTPGEFTDDARIQAAVKTALIQDQQIKGLAINTEVHRNVVSLYGRIPSESARDKAIRLAGQVRGVTKVEDRLTLVKP